MKPAGGDAGGAAQVAFGEVVVIATVADDVEAALPPVLAVDADVVAVAVSVVVVVARTGVVVVSRAVAVAVPPSLAVAVRVPVALAV